MSDQTLARRGFIDEDGPQFLQKLAPVVEKTLLLLQASSHSLASFPELQKVIRSSAAQVQRTFNTSEMLLVQCISTSNNMAKILLPVLADAVQDEHIWMAQEILDIAQTWIGDLIQSVNDMVNEYGHLNRNVAAATSHVIKTKADTEGAISDLDQKIKAIKEQVTFHEKAVKQKESTLEENQKAVNAATKKLQQTIDDIAERDRKFAIVAWTVPFIGAIIYAAQKAINAPKDKAAIQNANNKLTTLKKKRSELGNQLGEAQAELMKWQFQLTSETFNRKAVPDPVHLPEVQQCLTKIQNILLQLKSFWEGIRVMVVDLKQKTFAQEGMLKYLSIYKNDFLEALEIAKEAWVDFMDGCTAARLTFALKSKNAYGFLESSPPCRCYEEWLIQHNDLHQRLQVMSVAAFWSEDEPWLTMEDHESWPTIEDDLCEPNIEDIRCWHT